MDRRALTCLGTTLGGLHLAAALAAPAPTWQDMGAVAAVAREHVLRSVGEPAGRLVVTVAPPDDRLRLPACAAPLAETPEGQRPWGWMQVRVRCPGEAGWSLSLRARVQVFAPAVMARRAVTAGRTIESDDVHLAETDLTGLQRPPLRDSQLVVGRIARVGLAAGQVVVAEHLRLPVLIRRGSAVEVTATIGQVTVSSTGTAMQDGAAGELIRVKVPGGRLVEGMVTADGKVAVSSP
ncbi:MAG: flagellar basal body P-ring formation protein FlgA [Rhodocyclaceae bacterium]|nr:flagellar basal body P-ring formation protein FlgA [Rhodocyclaceae bacterium]